MRPSLMQMFRIAVVALLVACVTPATVGAQDESGDLDQLAELLDVGQFDGIEFAVSRTWSATSISPEPGRLLVLTTLILQFGSEDDASDALLPLSDIISDGYSEAGISLIESELDDDDQIGDETIRNLVDPDGPATDGAEEDDTDLLAGLTVLSVRSDETIVVVIALPLEGDAEATVLSMAQGVIDREAGDDSVSFDNGGVSMGGLFAQLPDADDPILVEAGVVPYYDTILYPVADQN